MNVAIIPARGGSKRIPRKNIRDFHGKPMIAWSIAAALASDCFHRVIVSTDDDAVAEVALRHGADVPFRRPASLSDDFTGTTPVVRHALEQLRAAGDSLGDVCCIYATAPFLRPDDLRQGLAMLRGEAADYAFSVTSFDFPIQRALRVTARGRVEMFWPEHAATRSQDLEEAFHDAGQFYWGTVDAWLAERPIFAPASVPVRLPRHRVQDIDTEEDWRRAELQFAALKEAGA